MEIKESPARKMSYILALETVRLCRSIQEKKKEYELTKQLVRSSTSIGANLEEAVGGQSDRDFLSKVSIAYKEARETAYWLKLMAGLGFLDDKQFRSLKSKTDQLIKMLGATMKTMKRKIRT